MQIRIDMANPWVGSNPGGSAAYLNWELGKLGWVKKKPKTQGLGYWGPRLTQTNKVNLSHKKIHKFHKNL